jgi:hypothetical protein
MTRSAELALLSLSAGSLIAFLSSAVVAQFRPPQTTTSGAAAAANSPIGLAIADVNGQMTVTGVAPNGPFAGGLHVGDQITGVNDDQAVANVSDVLSRFVATGNTGHVTTASLDVTRNGRPQAINVSNAMRPPQTRRPGHRPRPRDGKQRGTDGAPWASPAQGKGGAKAGGGKVGGKVSGARAGGGARGGGGGGAPAVGGT